MKSNPTREIKQGTCAYCGVVGDVTSDHVIPQCLWGGHAPSDVPVVEACRQCNHVGKSGNDAYLRDLLVNDQDALQSPIAQKIRQKFIRSVLTNRSHMDRDLRNHGKIVVTQRPSRLLVPSLVVEVAEKRTREIMSLIVRGLHHYYLHEPLPKDASFWIARLRTQEQIEGISNDIAAISGEYHRGATQCVGDGAVFSCAYVEMIADEHITLWRLNFYGNVVFAVMTNPIQVKEIAPE
jgi:hypothetical protein